METPANIGVSDQPDGSSTAVRQGMRWDLLWYIPLFAFVVWYFGFANAKAAYENIGLVLRHWTWMLLASPSAYVFFATAVYSVFLPIHFMLFIPHFFSVDADRPTYDRRYLFSFLVLVALIVAVVVTQLVIRGSFPLCWPSNGVERIRLVPLLPCPD
ncbi:MAG: hypothetical protein WCF26_25485 [Candidatus Sulfotelmatobacter sp.]